MATLLELNTIEENAQTAFDPGEAAEVTQARELLQKIQSAALSAAEDILDDASDPSGDSVALERIAWARRCAEGPRPMAVALLRLALADQPGGTSVAAILAATDSSIQSIIDKMVPRYAKGMLVNR